MLKVSLRLLLPISLLLFLQFPVLTQESENDPARKLFSEGLVLLREGNFEHALAAFEKSAALNPNQPATLGNIGTAAIRLGMLEKAESAFRQAIKLQPDQSGFHANLCEALGRQKKLSEAIEACNEGVRLNPTGEMENASRLTAYFQAGHPDDELERLFAVTTNLLAQSEVVNSIAANYYIRQGNYPRAVAILESLVRLRPSVSRYHGMLANTYVRLERDSDALASARTALQIDPQDSFANFAMGSIFFELGQHVGAIESFSRVSLDHPDSDLARFHHALSEIRRGRQADGIVILQRLVAQYPANFEYVRELGQALSDSDRFEESGTAYAHAMKLEPEDIRAIGGLGMTLMMRGDFDAAIRYFEQAFKIAPSNEIVKMFLGVARSRRTIVSRIPDFERAVRESPNSVQRRMDLARALAFAGRNEEASKHFGVVYKLDPSDDEIFHIIGVVYSEMGLDEKAAFAFRKAIEKGDNVGSHFNLALMYSLAGDFERASASYAKGISIKPDSPYFIKRYGDLLQENGKRREALEMYKRALAIRPSEPGFIFDAAVLSLRLGDKDAALTYLNILRSIDPNRARRLEQCFLIWG